MSSSRPRSAAGSMPRLGSAGITTAPDGRRVGLVHLDGEGMPHAHTKASSFFILAGRMALVGVEALEAADVEEEVEASEVGGGQVCDVFDDVGDASVPRLFPASTAAGYLQK